MKGSIPLSPVSTEGCSQVNDRLAVLTDWLLIRHPSLLH